MVGRKSSFGGDIAAQVLQEASQAKPAHTRSEVLVSRSKAMAAFGEDVSYERYLWIDPALCVPSPENARQYDDLNYENCQELIDSIKSEGRQRFAAIVRQTEDAEKPYEIVAGMRRHFAISWLRANNYSNFRYLIDIQAMDDEAAFRLSDLENRARTDITDIERGESYATALAKHYDGQIDSMAERLNINSRTLRRYLDLARLDTAIINALGGRDHVTVTAARDILPDLNKSEAHAHRVIQAAKDIATQQEKARGTGQGVIPWAEVVKQLKAAATATAQPQKNTSRTVKPVDIQAKSGATLFNYTPPARRAGAVIKLPANTAAPIDELKAAILTKIDELYSK